MDDLFQALDLDRDGLLLREELHQAAQGLGWGWRYAPLLAVLDLMTVMGPLSKVDYTDCMEQIIRDRNGPYGQVLLRSPFQGNAGPSNPLEGWRLDPEDSMETVSLLRRVADPTAADDYRAMLDGLVAFERPVYTEEAALLVIDPQRSFTKGVWMRSIGPEAETQVKPIELAFRNCAGVVRKIKDRMEMMISRCPFPPGSYDWDEKFAEAVGADQPYFIKPGNSILWPPTNGFRTWVDVLLARRKNHLILGGCTLNSCVRVSALEIQERFPIQVIVDLSLCGGRTGNHVRSPEFGGRSSVEAAVREMTSAGVWVAPRLKWP